MVCPGCHHLNLDQAQRCVRCGRPLFAAPASTSEFRSGQTLLGRYQLGPLLGEGAAGQVFQTHDQLLGRTIALKILKRELWESSKARERMAREAGALGRITHPNVVGIYNVFEHESALILELDFVEGGTLADRLCGGPLPLSEVRRVMAGILAGLAAIHDAGIVHRDIKPANILLTRDGTPRIADLGIARDMTALPMTGTGTKLGTTEYMSPEQIREEQVGPATDIYACGILLHELVTGSVPFDTTDEFALIAAHLRQAPNLALLESKAPPEVVHAVARALAKSPAHRWASARELGQSLAKVSTRPPERRDSGSSLYAAEVSPPPPRRTSLVKVVAVLVAVVFFFSVLLLGVLFIGYLRFGSDQWFIW
jgi:serine/threonine protein kinase